MIGWIDASSGASGDMLLAALIDAGAEAGEMEAAIASVAPEPTRMSAERVRRAGLDALRVHVEVDASTTHRGLDDILALIGDSSLDPIVAGHVSAVFTRLGEIEAAVHGVSTNDVHFHELGALDAIADVVGVCAGMASLELEVLHCSPVAVGSGTVSTSHGQLGVPPPAVAALLTGAPSYAGTEATELCTPTGAALLRHWVSEWGPQPLMSVARIGAGAGAKDFTGHPNILRMFVGAEVGPQIARPEPPGRPTRRVVVLETNVDDLDPRLWPAVLDRLLAAGASDAWLTPILMKKGRPAHTLSVLATDDRVDDVHTVVFSETSAIGLRVVDVTKVALEREVSEVAVGDQRIGVKIARRDGAVVNVQPEYEDVAAAARALGRPTKAVLAEAVAEASRHWAR